MCYDWVTHACIDFTILTRIEGTVTVLSDLLSLPLDPPLQVSIPGGS